MRLVWCLATAIVPTTAAVAQQQRATELSVGLAALGITTFTGGSALVHFQANQRLVSLAFYPSRGIAIEPTAGVAISSGRGRPVTIVQVAADVPIYLEPTWGHTGFYFAQGVAMTFFSAEASGAGAAARQVSVRFAVGDKLWLSELLSLRVSGNVAYAFATSRLADALTLNAQFGLSVFLR